MQSYLNKNLFKENDIDFWLNTQTIEQVKEPLKEKQNEDDTYKVIEEQQLTNNSKVKKHKKKHKDNKTEEKYEQFDQEKILNDNQNDLEIVNKKNLYEELAANKHVKLSYKIYPNYMNLNQIIIDVKIQSSSLIQQMYSIEFNILETLNAKLVRDVSF
jgi:hypothetical protein